MWDWDEIGYTLIKVFIILLSLRLLIKCSTPGGESLLEEMNKYGNVRIGGKVYVIEEVINNGRN